MSFTLIKAGGGIVTCVHATITNCLASPSSTFYAVSSTGVGTTTGWTFGLPSPTVPSIAYNSKTIDFADYPYDMRVDPRPPRVINKTLSGSVEVVVDPHIDIFVTVDFRPVDDADLRAQLMNWWQWAQNGGEWSIALDSIGTVDTALSADHAAGVTTLNITDTNGILPGRRYKVIDGPYHQIVTIHDVTGPTAATIEDETDFALSSGAIFRDVLLFPGYLEDPEQESPITDLPAEMLQPSWPCSRFELHLKFMELAT